MKENSNYTRILKNNISKFILIPNNRVNENVKLRARPLIAIRILLKLRN